MIEDGFNQQFFGNSPTIVYKCLHTAPPNKTPLADSKGNKFNSIFSRLFQKENQTQLPEIKSPPTLNQ